MAVEAAVAIGAGVAAHSLVLEAFGIDSVIELTSAGVLIWRRHATPDLHTRPRAGGVSRKRRAFLGGGGLIGGVILLGVPKTADPRRLTSVFAQVLAILVILTALNPWSQVLTPLLLLADVAMTIQQYRGEHGGPEHGCPAHARPNGEPIHAGDARRWCARRAHVRRLNHLFAVSAPS